MRKSANDRRDPGPALRAIGAAVAWLLATIVTVGAAEPDFTVEERRRLARLTKLPADGELDAAKLADMTFAVISAQTVPDFGDVDCRILGRLPKLTSVTLRGLPLSGTCVDGLPRGAMNLTLDGVAFAPDTLTALGRMPGLVTLRIEGGSGLTPRLAEALPPTSPLVRLVVGKVDGETLAALRRVPRLTELEIGEAVGPQGLTPLDGALEIERLDAGDVRRADLAVIAALPKLVDLSAVVAAEVKDDDLRLLNRSKTLKTVFVNFAAGTAAGVGVLAEMPRLDHLRLVYQTVPDRDLAQLARSRTLTALDLREADVTEAGLLNLLKSRSLKSVNLWRVGVSEKTRRKLAKRFELD